MRNKYHPFFHTGRVRTTSLKNSFKLLEIEKDFETEQQFLLWKNSIENWTNSSFVSRGGTRDNGAGVVYKYYDCNRSGKPGKPTEQPLLGQCLLFIEF